jgi:type II secretory pathway component PulF
MVIVAHSIEREGLAMTTAQQLDWFWREFSRLISHDDLTRIDILNNIEKRIPDPIRPNPLKKIIIQMWAGIVLGKFLWGVMEKTDFFSRTEIGMIEAGENGGEIAVLANCIASGTVRTKADEDREFWKMMAILIRTKIIIPLPVLLKLAGNHCTGKLQTAMELMATQAKSGEVISGAMEESGAFSCKELETIQMYKNGELDNFLEEVEQLAKS